MPSEDAVDFVESWRLKASSSFPGDNQLRTVLTQTFQGIGSIIKKRTEGECEDIGYLMGVMGKQRETARQFDTKLEKDPIRPFLYALNELVERIMSQEVTIKTEDISFDHEVQSAKDAPSSKALAGPSSCATPNLNQAQINGAASTSVALSDTHSAIKEEEMDTETDFVESLHDKELLRGIYRMLQSQGVRMDRIEEEVTAIRTHIESNGEERETEANDFTEKSPEAQEDVTFDEETTQRSRKRPLKKINYYYISEEEVDRLDIAEDSCAVFGGKLADVVFPEDQQFLIVDDRDQKIYNWIVDVVYARRANSDIHSNRNSVQSRIRSHLNQKARRLRDEFGMEHPLPVAKRQKEERTQLLKQVADKIAADEAADAVKRRKMISMRAAAVASKQLTRKQPQVITEASLRLPQPPRHLASNPTINAIMSGAHARSNFVGMPRRIIVTPSDRFQNYRRVTSGPSRLPYPPQAPRRTETAVKEEEHVDQELFDRAVFRDDRIKDERQY